MIELNYKKYISIEEFTEVYKVSKTSQQNYRSRRIDPLPYQQKVEKGKVLYKVSEVEKWFEHQHKSGKL